MARVFDLSDLDSDEGFTINGNKRSDHTGASVSSAGDVNGDGIDDLLVGAPEGWDGGAYAGETYVIFGRDVPGGDVAFSDLDLTRLKRSDGFIIQGAANFTSSGASVSEAGDVNGDGIGDLIVGVPQSGEGGAYAGGAYVIFGRDVAGGARAFRRIDLADLDPADGFFIQGADRNDEAGTSVSEAGDVNGDGIADLIVGAPGNEGGAHNAGAAYVIFGRDVAGGAEAFADIDLSRLGPGDGFLIQGGGEVDNAGFSVSTAGDVNGDGVDDLIVGVPRDDNGDNNTGGAYVIFGRDVAAGAAAFDVLDLGALDPADGFLIQGDAARDKAGWSVSSAGDVNGDGIADLIIGANTGDDGGGNAGEAYVVFGRDVAGGAAGFGTIDLSALDPSDGFIIQGVAAGDELGFSVSNVGDVNGDGIDDLIVGAPYGDGTFTDAGAAYVIYGRDVAGGADAFTTIDLTDLDPADGFIILGKEERDWAGLSVSGAGDVNGDGIADLVVGAPGSNFGTRTGEAFVIYGRPKSLDLRGDDTANLLVGDGNDDTLRGLGGDDTLRGLQGHDLLRGGAGADELRGGIGDDDLAGNQGTDTLSGGLGDDLLSGRGDDDILQGSEGKDTLKGGDGADTLTGGMGFDRLNGGDGQDLLEGGPGNDRFIFAAAVHTSAGAGDTISDFAAGDRIILGRIDADTASAGTNEAFTWLGRAAFTNTAGELRYERSGADALIQGDVDGDGVADLEITLIDVDFLTWADFDDLAGAPMSHTLTGSASANAIYGDIFGDTLRGHGGDDLLDGASGDDLLRGNAGNDALWGRMGADTLYGNTGDDTLYASAENNGSDHAIDHLYGGAGNDSLFGDWWDDVLYGGSGDDLLLRGEVLNGGTGNDTLRYGDEMKGGGGDDLLQGGFSRQVLRGNAGADTISGGSGHDWIKGGRGQDSLTGGDQRDHFIYGSVDHSLAGAGDVITDFNAPDSRNDRDTPDVIHLERIDADATTAGTDEGFTWIADAAFTGTAGELRYEATGADALVQADVDGDGLADFEITLRGVTALAQTDFIL